MEEAHKNQSGSGVKFVNECEMGINVEKGFIGAHFMKEVSITNCDQKDVTVILDKTFDKLF